jgi:SAM-dependent methyltransferase
MSPGSSTIDPERAVRERYGAAARVREAALCCPVDYDARYLAAIPAEVIERDYGCGDPSRHVRGGDVVLDLGSGGGKICFIAAQLVGKQGRVIGVGTDGLRLQPHVATRSSRDEGAGVSRDARPLRGRGLLLTPETPCSSVLPSSAARSARRARNARVFAAVASIPASRAQLA